MFTTDLKLRWRSIK